MLEIEVKYKVDDLTALRQRLLELQATPEGIRHDADSYFNASYRDFAKTDEALRIRQIGAKNFLTYKGPRIDAQTKTRREIEVPFEEGPAIAEQLRELLMELGFRPVAIVQKSRESFSLTRNSFELAVTLDDVQRVGTFAELEIVADESELERAKAVLFAEAAALGLTHIERRSYLEMLLSLHTVISPEIGD
jgi:adenylate cyclase class 2